MNMLLTVVSWLVLFGSVGVAFPVYLTTKSVYQSAAALVGGILLSIIFFALTHIVEKLDEVQQRLEYGRTNYQQ